MTSLVSCSRSSTSTAPVSVSPATPRLRSTSWQNWWMVAIVAASYDVSASVSRPSRVVRSAASASSSQSCSRLAGSAVVGSASTAAASSSWRRTRSRSSWLAARVNVTTSISSRVATPSAR